MAEADVDAVIAMMYAGALVSDRWNEAFVAIAHLVGAKATGSLIQSAGTEELIDFKLIGVEDTAWADVYPIYYHAIDPAYRVIRGGASGQMYPMHLHISENDVKRSEYFQDFYIRAGMRYSCGGSVLHNGRRLILSAHRPVGAPPFDQYQVDALKRLLGHLPHVLDLRDITARTHYEKSISLAALDSVQEALLIVDSNMVIRYLNSSAKHLLDNTKFVRIYAGALTMSEPRLQHQLTHRVREACLPKTRSHSEPLYSVDSNGRPVLEIRVVPLLPEVAQEVCDAQPRALIKLRQPFCTSSREAARTDSNPYGLTPAEIKLARALVSGLTPAEYAKSAAIKISTVRSQIQSILAKTGTRRVTEAVVLFSSTMAVA